MLNMLIIQNIFLIFASEKENNTMDIKKTQNY